MSKTIEEIKSEVAKEYIKSGERSTIGQLMTEVAQRYAKSQTQKLQEQNAELVEMLERAKLEFKQFRDAFGQGSLLINEIEQLILKHNKQ